MKLLVISQLFFSFASLFCLCSRIKRADIDLQTCIDNFDVHKDKIIRTQDSTKMGAKYLNEIDLGSREECLRLCCETENCDVFVYEDKNSGSCYLFHCGPPEDFKCKFTQHVNYSSAVLAINRHLPDLESQIKLTKHEQDLSKLRKQDENDRTVHIPEKIIPLVTTTTAKSNEVPKSKTDSPEEKKCSRYQFECRSTKECIAIYNACDGIPQCADGSDESELGCPDPVATTISTTVVPAVPQRVNNLPQPPVYDKNLPVRNREQLAPVPAQDVYKPRVPEIQPPPPNYGVGYPDISGVPDYQAARWNSRPPNQMYLPPVYPEKGSQIFAHKETGLQMPEGDISQYPDPNSRDYQKGPYEKVYYGEPSYHQPLDNRNNWVPQGNLEDPRYYGRYPENKNWNNLPPAKDAPPMTNYPSFTSPERKNPEHIQIKMAHELKHSKDSIEVPKETTIKPITVKPNRNEYPDVYAYKMDEKDGFAETPNGAVLSLTLGLIITAIMAIVIGCRLRVVRRRIRKGGKGYAHDADFLVNGMYL